jgi:hypothetical protein
MAVRVISTVTGSTSASPLSTLPTAGWTVTSSGHPAGLLRHANTNSFENPPRRLFHPRMTGRNGRQRKRGPMNPSVALQGPKRLPEKDATVHHTHDNHGSISNGKHVSGGVL